jgi:hypothetical protein
VSQLNYRGLLGPIGHMLTHLGERPTPRGKAKKGKYLATIDHIEFPLRLDEGGFVAGHLIGDVSMAYDGERSLAQWRHLVRWDALESFQVGRAKPTT